jgi:hypothetical protein
MKSGPSFDSTLEFKRFTEVMRKVIAVPKAEMDRRVAEAAASSPRKDNPASAGRKRTKRRVAR